MSVYFLFNNIHFALELMGALFFAIAAWLAFDAFFIRRDFLTASRGIGFGIVAVAHVVHGLTFAHPEYELIGHILYIVGLLLLLLNLFLEYPVDRPSLKAVAITPAALLTTYGGYVAAGLYLLVSFLAYMQYKKEAKKSLAPFCLAFLLLSIGAVVAELSGGVQNTLWIVAHGVEILAFVSLAVWVWQYLAQRLQEEIMLIYTSIALFISISVTLAFSIILINQIQLSTEANLSTNSRVIEYTLSALKDEYLAKTQSISVDPGVQKAIKEKDFAYLEETGARILAEQHLGFLTFVDKDGFVLVRAHALSRRDDNVAKEGAAGSALLGTAAVTIEAQSPEDFSIRAAAPVYSGSSIIGAVVSGAPLDAPFVDNLKRLTGLDVTIFSKDIVSASTILGADHRSRISGIRIVEPQDSRIVLEKGEPLSIRLDILSRPFLASFLPIRNNSGAIVGMISALRSQEEMLEIATQTNILTLATVAIILLVLMIPLYAITKRLGRER